MIDHHEPYGLRAPSMEVTGHGYIKKTLKRRSRKSIYIADVMENIILLNRNNFHKRVSVKQKSNSTRKLSKYNFFEIKLNKIVILKLLFFSYIVHMQLRIIRINKFSGTAESENLMQTRFIDVDICMEFFTRCKRNDIRRITFV